MISASKAMMGSVHIYTEVALIISRLLVRMVRGKWGWCNASLNSHNNYYYNNRFQVSHTETEADTFGRENSDFWQNDARLRVVLHRFKGLTIYVYDKSSLALEGVKSSDQLLTLLPHANTIIIDPYSNNKITLHILYHKETYLLLSSFSLLSHASSPFADSLSRIFSSNI